LIGAASDEMADEASHIPLKEQIVLFSGTHFEASVIKQAAITRALLAIKPVTKEIARFLRDTGHSDLLVHLPLEEDVGGFSDEHLAAGGKPQDALAASAFAVTEQMIAAIGDYCDQNNLAMAERLKIETFGSLHFSPARKLSSISCKLRLTSAQVRRSAPFPEALRDMGDVVLLKAMLPSLAGNLYVVDLQSNEQPWAEVVAVVRVTLDEDVAPITLVLVRPLLSDRNDDYDLKLPVRQLRTIAIDQSLCMPRVRRAQLTARLIAVHPNSVLAPVHWIPWLPSVGVGDSLSEEERDPDLAARRARSLYINWWILRSDDKYPVAMRDEVVGLRGWGARPE
jgi:hypothetical protein